MTPEDREILFASKTEEYRTPTHIIEAVIECLGEIDLDPCASPLSSIPCKLQYTKHENSLDKPWHGKVYMNPPYGASVKPFIKKIIQEYETGNVSEAIVLIAARTETKWFNMLNAYPWCAVDRRLKFIDIHGRDSDSAPFPSALVYLGIDTMKFHRIFRKYGVIWRQIVC